MFRVRGYLLEVGRRQPKERFMREWVDILARCRYSEFRPVAGAPGDGEEIEIDFSRLQAYCRMQGLEMVKTDPAEVCGLYADSANVVASTSSERSLAGRVEDMRENMQRAEAAGRSRAAERFLVADLGDECMWQPPVASLPGLVMGGSFAAGGAKAAKMDLERELDSILDAPLGGLVLRLGTLYLLGGAIRDGASEFFNILANPHGYSRHPAITQPVLDEVGAIARAARIVAERWVDRNDWAKEIVYMANLLDAACHRRDETRLRELRDEHSRIWRMRFMEPGRTESLARLPRF